MKPQVDETDYKILEALIENCKLSYRDIAKKTGLNPMTVMNRIKKMEESRVIKQYSAKVDHNKIGLSVVAYVLINANYDVFQKKGVSSQTIAESLVKYPFISCISTTTGRSDILIRVRARDVEELNAFSSEITQMEGVKRTETLVVLHDVGRNAVTHKKLMTFLSDDGYRNSFFKQTSLSQSRQ